MGVLNLALVRAAVKASAHKFLQGFNSSFGEEGGLFQNKVMGRHVTISRLSVGHQHDSHYLFFLNQSQACHITLLKRETLVFGDFGKSVKLTYCFLLYFTSLFFSFFLPIKVKSLLKSKAVTNNVCDTM